MTERGSVLLIETATSHALVGLGRGDGSVLAADAWQSGHRHGEELLPRLDHLLSSSGTARGDLTGVAVGTGPGSFTGLRIGMATAKTICYGLRLPILGLPTMELLAIAAGDGAMAVVLPAGVGDRYVARYQVKRGEARELMRPTLTPAARVAEQPQPGDMVVAVDVPESEASAEALELGRRAQVGLAGVMAVRAARALAAGESVDLASLVPQYVALPRGVPASAEEMAWSPDLR